MPEVWQIIQSGVVSEGKVDDVSHISLSSEIGAIDLEKGTCNMEVI
jgi:hypothetical protein